MKLFRHQYFMHILWWTGLYFFWVMVFQKRSFAFSQTATIEFCYLLFISANFYFNIFFAIPRFLYTRRYLGYAFLFLSGVFVTGVLRVPLALFMNGNIFLVGKAQPTASALFLASFLNIFIWSALIVFVKIVMDRFRFQQYVEEIKKEKSKAELDFLNAQLNPHFLFNSIHSIYGHIDKNNDSARNMLLTFSDMLRYQLYDCNSETIDMNKEMEYLKNYVLLQRARKEKDMVVNLQVDKNLRGLKIAPLLFICFVENAFKYVGLTEEGENQIDISFERQQNDLVFKCRNTKDPAPGTNIEHKGIGIANTRRRLELHYPEQHLLEIQEDKQYYSVKLKIELDAVEMHYSG
ncbi:MAG: sensor histidine kinase [Flavisolibacter sp.]|jgi:two-component system LytT family sensor kinase